MSERNEIMSLLRLREYLERRISKASFELEVARHALERVKILLAIEEAFKR
jgi:hypothetical protein